MLTLFLFDTPPRALSARFLVGLRLRAGVTPRVPHVAIVRTLAAAAPYEPCRGVFLLAASGG